MKIGNFVSMTCLKFEEPRVLSVITYLCTLWHMKVA